MATYLADRVIVFEGQPARAATATPYDVFFFTPGNQGITSIYRPQSLLTGMNRFLASLEITFRRDPTNFRPRVNKANSIKDREQKGQLTIRPCFIIHSVFCSTASGNYFFLED